MGSTRDVKDEIRLILIADFAIMRKRYWLYFRETLYGRHPVVRVGNCVLKSAEKTVVSGNVFWS